MAMTRSKRKATGLASLPDHPYVAKRINSRRVRRDSDTSIESQSGAGESVGMQTIQDESGDAVSSEEKTEHTHETIVSSEDNQSEPTGQSTGAVEPVEVETEGADDQEEASTVDVDDQSDIVIVVEETSDPAESSLREEESSSDESQADNTPPKIHLDDGRVEDLDPNIITRLVRNEWTVEVDDRSKPRHCPHHNTKEILCAVSDACWVLPMHFENCKEAERKLKKMIGRAPIERAAGCCASLLQHVASVERKGSNELGTWYFVRWKKYWFAESSLCRNAHSS
ncbi:hypothetical protein D8B26_005365 [Coccidioides posadasii str. Silveira]|uniref:Uncharacterized protein n=1 Tax=Coccidioides posadasii (strain RMSCC 757 / Silveira) TaxID=443226 RepID=E9D534_COCPS|nr:conserved hypothetical protein [Coccidioides posadasii str. Silveira]QVM10712.1 hypothetical protein D8B26_005365 [Coccidioides posadasii str. Silveira]